MLINVIGYLEQTEGLVERLDVEGEHTFILSPLEDEFPEISKHVPTIAVGYPTYEALVSQGFTSLYCLPQPDSSVQDARRWLQMQELG